MGKVKRLKQEITEFLNIAGLERVSDGITFGRKIIEVVGVEKALAIEKSWGNFSEPLVMLEPRLFNVWYSQYPYYDARIEHLAYLVSAIDSGILKKSGNITIVDGGCGSGLDMGFLAKHYQKNDYVFKGYDKEAVLIEMANHLKSQFCLNNLSFYAGDNEKPLQKEESVADMLYTNSSFFFVAEKNNEKAIARFNSLLSRVKPEGIYLSIGENLYQESPEVLDFFRQIGINHLRCDKLPPIKRVKEKCCANIFRIELNGKQVSYQPQP